MKIKPIRDQESYHAALKELEKLMIANPSAGSAKADELELLALVIESYEKEHFPPTPPDPVEAIKFRLEQEGKSTKDLEPYLGGKEGVRAVLARKRSLTLQMIRDLHKHFGIPAEALIAEAA